MPQTRPAQSAGRARWLTAAWRRCSYRSPAPANVTCTWQQLDLPPASQATVRDLWARALLGNFTGLVTLVVEPTAAAFLRVSLLPAP